MSTDTRAEQAMPAGYHPHRVTEPPARASRTADPTTLAYLAEGLAEIEMAADDPAASQRVKEEAAGLGRLVRAIATGALALAVIGGAILAPGATSPASATEAPQPDPTATATADAPVFRVVLGSPTVHVRFPLVIPDPVDGSMGLHCGRVLGPDPTFGINLLGQACGRGRFVTVTARIDAAALNYGPHNTVWLIDDAHPGTWAPVTLDARRPTQVDPLFVADAGAGQAWIVAQVRHYSPAALGYVASKRSPVRVVELTRRGPRTRGTITTDGTGRAQGVVRLGAGKHILRLVRPDGASVWGASSSKVTVTVTAAPLDVS